MRYRAEVDGLRAIAVVGVILFHAHVHAFRGGYVGVDVFFVISGYLITSILLNDLREHRFSISNFYEKRARRILPALFFVIACCIPPACSLLSPAELDEFSRSIVATLVFLPNVFFWKIGGYFGGPSEEKPLLHMWSLGVEEQFYVLFPLALALAFRLARPRLSVLLAACALASFGLSWIMLASPSANFYLLPTRAWELLIGSLVATWTPSRASLPAFVRRSIALFGAVLIVVSICCLDESTPFPGPTALLPTVGAAAILGFANSSEGTGRLLAHPVLVYLGRISYSAYLWHQPLFAFARIHQDGAPDTATMALAVLLTVALAAATWRWVEAPFRSPQTVSRRGIVMLAATGSLLLATGAVTGIALEGFPQRFSPQALTVLEFADRDEREEYTTSRFASRVGPFSPGSGDKKLLIVGDSFAQDLVNAGYEVGAFRHYDVRTRYVHKQCQMYLGPEDVGRFRGRSAAECESSENLDDFLVQIRSADTIVMASCWQAWSAERLPQTVRALQLRPSQRLFVVGPKKFGNVRLRALSRLSQDQRIATRESVAGDVFEVVNLLRDGLPTRAEFVDQQRAICGSNATCPLFTPSGDLISYDGAHLTPAGARYVGRVLFSETPLAALRFSPDMPASSNLEKAVTR